MDIELKECPFCGCKPKMGSLGGDKQNWCIWCPNCKIACIEGSFKELMSKKWNRRVSDGQKKFSALKSWVDGLPDIVDVYGKDDCQCGQATNMIIVKELKSKLDEIGKDGK